MSTARYPLDVVTARGLLLASVLTLTPLLWRLSPWVALVTAVPLAWQALRLRRPGTLRRVPALPLALLTAGALAISLAQYGTLFGRTPGLALIAMLLGLKQLEATARRDAHVIVLLSFFVQLGYFLIEQSTLTALLALGACAVSVAALLRAENPNQDWRQALARSTRTLVLAVPLAAALFILFPRLDKPLWGLPRDAESAQSGLSDTMTPGAIADLSLSGDIAFRVEFSGAIPPQRDRYFRGPVLSRFDGRTWRAAATAARPMAGGPAGAGAHVVTLEPHQRHWLLGLEHSTPAEDHLRDGEGVLLAREPLRSRRRVQMASVTTRTDMLDASEAVRRRALQLPDGSNPRTRAFGASLAERHAGSAQRVDAAIAYLRAGNFVYTLQPPKLEQDSADALLFDTRQGFCEHFASAFVVLMRAADVPARVVTGYQGGELNPFDRTLVVRQSDAHAWAEVWLPGAGWTRIDPTAAAAPSRIEGGLSLALQPGEPLPMLARSDLSWLRPLRDRAEALAHAWNTWVLGYNAERQRSLLRQLGLTPDWTSLAALLAGAGLVWQGAVWWWVGRHKRQDALERAWRKVLRHLARAGFVPRSDEGPLDFGARVCAARPEWADTLPPLVRRYAALRYGPPHPPQALSGFIREIDTWLSHSGS